MNVYVMLSFVKDLDQSIDELIVSPPNDERKHKNDERENKSLKKVRVPTDPPLFSLE